NDGAESEDGAEGEDDSDGEDDGERDSTVAPYPTVRCRASVAVPTTANGQRSRSHSAANSSTRSCGIPTTYRSWDSLHHSCIGASEGASLGTLSRSITPPTPQSLSSSGIALDSPPAPTSWIDRIGLSAPSPTQRSMTSWQRRSISGLSRCTEAKSSASSLLP